MRKIVLWVAAVAVLFAALPLAAAVCVPPDRGTWSTRAPYPLVANVRAWGTYFPDNGKFYAFGGRTADGTGNDVLNPREYDPVTDTWATKSASFADAQVDNMVGGVLDFGGTNLVVLVGGSAGGTTVTTDQVRAYDPLADTMTPLASDGWPGAGGTTTLPGGAAVYNNKLYVFGGFVVSPGSMVDNIWEFDPAAAAGSRWTEKTATLPTGLGYIPAATSGANIYLLGGSMWDGATLVDTVSALKYDPVGDVISTVTAIPRATAETRANTQTDGTIWVLGGGRTAPNPSAEVDIYDPVADLWSTGPALTNARRNFAADVDPATGRIWAVGGYDIDGITPLGVNEEYVCWIFVDGFEAGNTSAWSLVVP